MTDDSASRHVRCGRISGLWMEDRDLALLANMDSRAPRANRGDGVKRQGCYRPDAVSVRPTGHESGYSLSTREEGLGTVRSVQSGMRRFENV
jgi:hypothetical protein